MARTLAVLILLLLHSARSVAAAESTLEIPFLDRAPALEDFLDMKPRPEWEGKLARAGTFVQSLPSDGQAASQQTDVYAGYDRKNLYVIFVALDSEAEKIRGRMTRREDLNNDDDWVELALDTFNDQRRAYLFDCSPLGIQWDALWTEGAPEDDSFDTLWYSRGSVTEKGYLVWMAIPFKSLRFPDLPMQEWRIQFRRWLPRVPELSAWPHISTRIEGRLNQAARLEGLKDISPGRNMQLIPYGTFRSYRALDTRDPGNPHIVRDQGDVDGGLDAKIVLKDSLVLDVTANPDFSQVESDDPQLTANQRFEVFFPEKRPFFLENANYFQTPINLVFSRRIADPQFGVRLTGKTGPYAVGAFLIDDEAPGKRVVPPHPLAGEQALLGIFRISRDISRQSNIGFIFTDREFQGSHNRVGGIDGRFKLNSRWVAYFQAVASTTEFLDGSRHAGPAYEAGLARSGRQFTYDLSWSDRSAGFVTQTGFDPRPDIRSITQSAGYDFRPEGKRLIAWGPRIRMTRVWDHHGTRLDNVLGADLAAEFRGQTDIGFGYTHQQERLRLEDYPGLPRNLDFSQRDWNLDLRSSYLSQVSFFARYNRGQRINFLPPQGREPHLADWDSAKVNVTLRPFTRLRIDNAYLMTRLRDLATGGGILTNHIARSKWNWQFSRELSVRFILQYESLLASPGRTQLETTKKINSDFLITYLLNPWTALFVGFNGNAQNIAFERSATGTSLVRPRNHFLNDANQFFVKLSYLLRF